MYANMQKAAHWHKLAKRQVIFEAKCCQILCLSCSQHFDSGFRGNWSDIHCAKCALHGTNLCFTIFGLFCDKWRSEDVFCHFRLGRSVRLGTHFIKIGKKWFVTFLSRLKADYLITVGWVDCKKFQGTGIKIGKFSRSSGWQDIGNDTLPQLNHCITYPSIFNCYDCKQGCASGLRWSLYSLHECATSGIRSMPSFLRLLLRTVHTSSLSVHI